MLPDPQAPETYPRRILLAVSGLAPQVVTENLYFLCCTRQPSFVPTELRIVSTDRGREIAELSLLHEDQGMFWDFVKDYGLEGQIAFDSNMIHVLRNSKGEALEDIRSEADMSAAADAIINLVRELTLDPNSALHVSITGGRNSIGVYLGLAMTLYGRPQDRLSQVMVAEEFLSNHDFYYPPPEPEVLIGKNNNPVSTANAGILLSEIPLVMLRHGLPENLISGEATYMATVAAAKRSFAPANLVVDYSKRRLICGDQEVVLPPQHFAWYAWMARRRLQALDYGGHVGWRDKDIADEFLQEYKNVIGHMAHGYEEAANNLADGMSKEFFDEKKSRVNRLLRETLGLGAAPYLIHPSGKRPSQRFGLSIPITSIFVTSRGTAS
jgi:CRISPR-associated protein (TIGR02584 family)